MTTTVRVDAHCDMTKYEVEITEVYPDGFVNKTVIQNGEQYTNYVYDTRSITVREIAKV